MTDFKYEAGKLDPHETLQRVQNALKDNNPLLALIFINQYFNYLDIEFHVDNAIKAFKERIINDK
jgi:hypothetical protein